MVDTVTASFIITTKQKTCLKKWAAADDRSVSYILRDILEKECLRREAQQQKATSVNKARRR